MIRDLGLRPHSRKSGMFQYLHTSLASSKYLKKPEGCLTGCTLGLLGTYVRSYILNYV